MARGAIRLGGLLVMANLTATRGHERQLAVLALREVTGNTGKRLVAIVRKGIGRRRE
jgi:hypothetical protein